MIPWTIDTKYYTAEVDLWLDHIESDAEAAVKAFVEDENGVCEVVDGLVLVFRKDEPKSLEDLKLWSAFVEKCDPNVKIVIGTEGDLPETDKDAIEDWCLENMFVYIDAEEKAQKVDDDEFEDRVGIPLLLETLQSNMWDGLVTKSSAQAPLDTNEARLQMLDLIDEEDGEMTDLPSSSEIKKMQQELFGAFDDPNDGLDHVFTKIQELRDQGANLPDSERRKLAAKVALSFASYYNETAE
ncbi:hypothetical protein K450DRAFT_239941 [Umbelopsis ramanniana AG]|uniref:Alpha-and gamma-adaptin-binding protein p34 n=1 Tax=Umbelopsis ramanniana AG TaxID=1314678 RepID=A0AAD5EB16_UMBRA|nr:uncharacterized protein K450DRAFT_239941 [Umbelopsis ramanniana AG]KAI8579964.1 hypothetical protein K450DRAFT_239941 [Umbelopsis ramanniana AG]